MTQSVIWVVSREVEEWRAHISPPRRCSAGRADLWTALRMRYYFFARVRAAFLAAWDLSRGPFVFAAFRAALDLSAAERFLDALRACFDNASRDTVLVGSFFNAFFLAADLFLVTGT